MDKRPLIVGSSAVVIAAIAITIVAWNKDHSEKWINQTRTELANFWGYHLEIMETESIFNCRPLIDHNIMRDSLNMSDFDPEEINTGRVWFSLPYQVARANGLSPCEAIRQVYDNEYPFTHPMTDQLADMD